MQVKKNLESGKMYGEWKTQQLQYKTNTEQLLQEYLNNLKTVEYKPSPSSIMENLLKDYKRICG